MESCCGDSLYCVIDYTRVLTSPPRPRWAQPYRKLVRFLFHARPIGQCNITRVFLNKLYTKQYLLVIEGFCCKSCRRLRTVRRNQITFSTDRSRVCNQTSVRGCQCFHAYRQKDLSKIVVVKNLSDEHSLPVKLHVTCKEQLRKMFTVSLWVGSIAWCIFFVLIPVPIFPSKAQFYYKRQLVWIN